MAKPILYRYSDNFIISDKCIEWTDWSPSWAFSEAILLGGGVHVQSWGDAQLYSSATFRFRDSTSNSTHANKRLLAQMIQEEVNDFKFLDLEGVTSRIAIAGPPGVERLSSRHILITHISVVLRQVAIL